MHLGVLAKATLYHKLFEMVIGSYSATSDFRYPLALCDVFFSKIEAKTHLCIKDDEKTLLS